jgi:hypothetical protein
VSLFLPLKRATVLIPSGPEGDENRKHLFILLTDPYRDESGSNQVLLVSISTIRPGLPHDASCLLYPGDHEFVKTESYVLYQKSRLENAERLMQGVKNGLFVPQSPIDTSIFARICKGLEESRFTPAKHLNFYEKTRGGSQGAPDSS